MAQRDTGRWAGWIWGLAAGFYLALLYGTTPFMREILNVLRPALGVAFSPAVSAGVVAAGAAFVFFYRRGLWPPGLRRTLLLAVIVAAYGATMAVLPWPEERVHLVQYGLLAVLVTRWRRAVLVPRWRRAVGGALSQGWRLHGFAWALVALAGAGDEMIQWWLPNRVGDLRDVALNAWAALLAQGLLVLVSQRGPPAPEPPARKT